MARRDIRLTISEAAGFAGVSVRAVRHYHERGLLPEPPRDESGYRRYDANAVVDLIRIHALASAGVPLARVAELLDAGPDEFRRAVAEIDVALRTQIAKLEDRRRAVAGLVSHDGLALPPEVVDYLDHLRACGVGERGVAIERDGWLLLSARFPEHVAEWIADKRASLDDPRIVDLYKRFEQAYEWEPGDPRLECLADDLSAIFATEAPADSDMPDVIDETVAAMLDSFTLAASPGWSYLDRLLQQRGWSGWTNPEPT